MDVRLYLPEGTPVNRENTENSECDENEAHNVCFEIHCSCLPPGIIVVKKRSGERWHRTGSDRCRSRTLSMAGLVVTVLGVIFGRCFFTGEVCHGGLR